ncbi:hypothetical protein [Parafrankia sp. EUN1f]|uniref:hypothetical protein n=1 Tax=Parafrankia sp. EUN1f TaxID=102897 RepID=UPI0001C46D07|nr:hypothetical protein [Parafrankia sp. EUN1f]EFC80182.1 hypothetical protein FrEUN1fDRAFT_6711 [Parafrankia sp. EUN1f]
MIRPERPSDEVLAAIEAVLDEHTPGPPEPPGPLPDPSADFWELNAMRWMPEERQVQLATAEETARQRREEQYQRIIAAWQDGVANRWQEPHRSDGTETATRRLVDDYVRDLYSGGPSPVSTTPSGPLTWEDVRRMWASLPDRPRPPDRIQFTAGTLRAGMDRIAANNRYSRMIMPRERVFAEADTAAALEYLTAARHGHGLIAVLACSEWDFDRWRQEWNLPDHYREVFYVSDTQCGPQRLRGVEVLATVVLNGFEVHPRNRDLSAAVMARMRPIARDRPTPRVRGMSAGPAVMDEAVTFRAGGRAAGRTTALRDAVRGVPHAWVGRDGTVTYPNATPPGRLVTIAGHCWCGSRVSELKRRAGRIEMDGPVEPDTTRVFPCGHRTATVRVQQIGDRHLMWFHPHPRSCQ